MLTRIELKSIMRSEYNQVSDEFFESFFAKISDDELAKLYGMTFIRSGYFAAIR